MDDPKPSGAKKSKKPAQNKFLSGGRPNSKKVIDSFAEEPIELYQDDEPSHAALEVDEIVDISHPTEIKHPHNRAKIRRVVPEPSVEIVDVRTVCNAEEYAAKNLYQSLLALRSQVSSCSSVVGLVFIAQVDCKRERRRTRRNSKGLHSTNALSLPAPR